MGRLKKIKKVDIANKEEIVSNLVEEPKIIEKPKQTKEQLKRKELLLKLMNEKNRQYGSGTMKFASDEEIPERISFGVKELDELTGGGIAFKRVSVVYGSKGAGKTTLTYMTIAQAQKNGKLCAFIDLERCIPENTLIYDYNSHRVKKIQDIRIGDKVLSFDGSKFGIEEVSNIWENGYKDIYNIKTEIKNNELFLTDNHKVFTKNGWKEVKSLKCDDYLASPRNIEIKNMIDFVSRENSRAIGYMLGDGHFKCTQFANIDKEIIKDFETILEKNFNCKLTNYGNGCHWRISKIFKKVERNCVNCDRKFEAYPSTGQAFCSKKCALSYFNKNKEKYVSSEVLKKKNPTDRTNNFKKFIIELGLDGLIKEKKAIPIKIMESSLNIKLECLKGLFSTDGTIKENRNFIRFDNLSKHLIEQIKSILLEVGIVSIENSYIQSINNKRIYNLTIYGHKNIEIFYNRIGFVGEKQLKLIGVLKNKKFYLKKRNGKEFYSYRRTIEDLNLDAKLPIYWNKITSINKKGKANVYDLEIKNTGSLVVNNLLIHNSFDPIRAKLFGVNLEDLILANSFDNAEQAMDTLISMCKEKLVDYIVLDSVQALSPKGEQETKKGKEKSIEDDTMALLARKLSQFFRMSASGIYKGNVAILLIGQVRMNLGGFIALESLSGGKALEHWSAMTLNVRRGAKADAPTEKVETEDDCKEVIVGYNTIIKLEKTKITSKTEGNNVSIPFYFDKGYKGYTI
jgi:RecA/RadA recombinase/endogenous inhibitor of DNA gyrase (YacG/DUF329 family)